MDYISERKLRKMNPEQLELYALRLKDHQDDVRAYASLLVDFPNREKLIREYGVSDHSSARQMIAELEGARANTVRQTAGIGELIGVKKPHDKLINGGRSTKGASGRYLSGSGSGSSRSLSGGND